MSLLSLCTIVNNIDKEKYERENLMEEVGVPLSWRS